MADQIWNLRILEQQVADMRSPVRCNRCRGVYDLGKVEVTARYTDCSVWRTPCCGQTVDDRGETGWTLRKDYERIDRNNLYQLDVYGGYRYG